jgi:peptide/nickel transport system permease protein
VNSGAAIGTGQQRSALQRLLRHRSARWALIVIGIFVAAAVFGPMLDPYSSTAQPDVVAQKSLPPSWAHPIGTDSYSRDLLARVFSGARISLAIATLAVLISMTLGTAYGLVSGYVGGRVDAVMMRVLDGFLAIPRVLLLLVALTFWPRLGLIGLIVLLGVTGWFGVSRFVRAETLAARRLDYVYAARALGARDFRIAWRHILPNVMAPVIVTATLSVGNVIVLEAGLSYLGIGAPAPTATWGSIFHEAVTFFPDGWWMVLFPGIAIAATSMAFNVLGDALRDVLDPRQVHGSREVPALASVSITHASGNG